MAATSYSSIKDMSADFKTALSNLEYPYPFRVDTSSLVVLVDIENDLGDILAANPAKLAIIIGVDDSAPTICILGADSNGAVLAAHVNGTLDGQETWPESQIIKYDQGTEYADFFV
ncbi:MAG TPA: hypothetical protein VGD17_00405 [Chitinophagaceae bacterium]